MDWDQGYLINYLIIKYTSMGLYFAKFGIVIDKDRKEQVRYCWELRRELKKYTNAWDTANKLRLKDFKTKFGWTYDSEILFTPVKDMDGYTELNFKIIAPEGYTEEQKIIAEEYWHSLYSIYKEEDIEQEALDKYGKLFVEYIRGLWD
jgi:hypothetical protein